MNVVVMAPHPDDEAIGCGGTIAKHIRDGDKVKVIYITSGDAQGTAEVREAEAKKAGKLLGVSKQHFMRVPEGFSATKELSRKLKGIVLAENPETVYMPHKLENDPNHRNSFILIRDALKGLQADFYGYEVWTPISRPSLYVNIDKEVELKAAVIAEYGSQMGIINYVDLSLSLNRYRGATAKQGKYCEAFEKVSWR